jgi:hypothetical protein
MTIKKPISKKQYLMDLYWNGTDTRDPMNLPYWFCHLLSDGYVEIINSQCLVAVTEKGLEHIEQLGIVNKQECA